MSSKRRRKRARSSGGKAGSKPRAEVATREPPPEEAARERPQPPIPTLPVTVAAALRAVGASPAILGAAFLSLLATWAAYVALGNEPSPRTLSLLLSVPPVHVLSDAPIALAPGRGLPLSIAGVAGLAVLRAVTFGILSLLVVQAVRDGSASLRSAARQLPRRVPVFGSLYIAHFGMQVAAFEAMRGFLGPLAILAVAAGVYFLGYSPVVAAAEEDGPRLAVLKGVRAARLSGTRHLSLVLAYFLALFYSGSVAPFPPIGPATPSIGAWLYGLGATFVHVTVLASFAYRWLAIRDLASEPPAGR